MSSVTDHTLLADHMGGGAYLAAVLAVYSRRRAALVVPATAVTAAAALADPAPRARPRALERLAWLLGPDLGAVVRVQDHDAGAAYDTAATTRPPGPDTTGDAGDAGAYLLHAPVVWAARRLGMPVLTLDPKPYELYDVPTRTTP